MIQFNSYIARKRARFNSIEGPVNIPFGTVLNCQGGFLMLENKRVCGITSQNAYDFFSQNDDGRGQERGNLVGRILSKLAKRDKNHQSRWNRIWEDSRCQKYKRPEQEDYWLWNYEFYNAPVEDLEHIAALIGA